MRQTIAENLQWAGASLQDISDTPQLDASVLLAHVLKKPRSFLLAYQEKLLTTEEIKLFAKLIEQRCQRVPVAYLTGHREFWSLDFAVTRDTLIPRPETELLVELVLQCVTGEHRVIADLGTGSGAIALSIAHERPSWTVHAVEINESALQVAKENAQRLQITNVVFHQGDWCAALPKIKFDFIVSNPPYIAAQDPHLQQSGLCYEPTSALIADEEGFSDICKIMGDAKEFLKPGAGLALEHGYKQGMRVRQLFLEAGYQEMTTYQDTAGLDRITLAKREF